MTWNDLIAQLLEIPEERRNETATFTTGDFYDEFSLTEIDDVGRYTKVKGDTEEDNLELDEYQVPTSVMVNDEEDLPYPDTFILSA